MEETEEYGLEHNEMLWLNLNEAARPSRKTLKHFATEETVN